MTKSAVHEAFTPSARAQPRAGRRLSGAPRARLSRGLHPVAGAVAQAAGQPLGRPRAVGGAAPHLRARGRDRGLQAARILDASRSSSTPPTGERFTARLTHLDGKRLDKFDLANEAEARAAADAILARSRLRGRRGRDASRSAATRRRPSPPRPCSRKPRASSASAPAAPCASPSGSTRASISAARPSASSPICEPTASPCRTRRSPPRAQLIERALRRRLPARRAARLHAPRPRTRRRRTRRSARPICSAARTTCARYLDDEQRRLYELIWKRAVASQMASRRHRPGRGRHRAARRQRDACAPPARPSRSTASSRSITRIVDDPDEDEENRRLPPLDGTRRARRAARSSRSSISPSRRRATPRRAWSRSSRSSASAGPRPMPRSSRCCRTATMCGSTRSASSPRTAAASSPPS